MHVHVHAYIMLNTYTFKNCMKLIGTELNILSRNIENIYFVIMSYYIVWFKPERKICNVVEIVVFLLAITINLIFYGRMKYYIVLPSVY